MIAWLFLAANALACAGLAVQLSNLREFPRLRPRDGSDPVDVYVAMRDEARNAQAFLDAVLALENVARVVVADDESSDATPSVVAEYASRDQRVCYHRATGGKSSALASAVAAFEPRARWMLFLDADVRLERGAENALVALARERRAHAASVWLRVVPSNAAALLVAPAVTLFLLQALPMRLARGADPRFAAANGQCLLVARHAYERCGGHAAVESPVEDVALARALKRAGYSVALGSGALLGSVSPYDTLLDAMRGLGRSLYFGSGAAGCALVALWQSALCVAPLPLYCARLLSARTMREPAAGVVAAPLGAAFGAAAALLALVDGVRGRIRWRGRALPSGESAARP